MILGVPRNLLQLGLQVGEVVVAPDALLPATVADASDHRSVVLLVREHDAARHELLQRRQGGVVGDIRRGEKQRCFLAVEVGKLALQLDMVVQGAGDIARAAGASPRDVERRMHGREHGRMLAHAEIVVGAPHRDRPGAIGVKCRAAGKLPRSRRISANTR